MEIWQYERYCIPEYFKPFDVLNDLDSTMISFLDEQ